MVPHVCNTTRRNIPKKLLAPCNIANIAITKPLFQSCVLFILYSVLFYLPPGHQQGDWRRNKMHDNTAYGFDPHDDSDYLNIHDNVVYNNGNHGIIASKRCNDVSIQNNEVYNGDNAGLFLHRSSDNAIVKSELKRNA